MMSQWALADQQETRARVAELELALCDLYNLCMAKGWGTSPMAREMLAARRAIRDDFQNATEST